MQHKIADDGEILLKGPFVFKGYFKNPEATAEAIVDDWLHTGDIGEIDSDGFLRITDRKKHLIITAGGKNIAPANIEKAIKTESALISQVHAHGDRRPYVSAMIAPSPIETLAFGVQRGLVTEAELEEHTQVLLANPYARPAALNTAMAKVIDDDAFVKNISDAVRRGNEQLVRVAQVRRFILLERDFSQEEGEMTPTMKVRRRAIEQKFAARFDAIYSDPAASVNVG